MLSCLWSSGCCGRVLLELILMQHNCKCDQPLPISAFQRSFCLHAPFLQLVSVSAALNLPPRCCRLALAILTDCNRCVLLPTNSCALYECIIYTHCTHIHTHYKTYYTYTHCPHIQLPRALTRVSCHQHALAHADQPMRLAAALECARLMCGLQLPPMHSCW